MQVPVLSCRQKNSLAFDRAPAAVQPCPKMMLGTVRSTFHCTQDQRCMGLGKPVSYVHNRAPSTTITCSTANSSSNKAMPKRTQVSSPASAGGTTSKPAAIVAAAAATAVTVQETAGLPVDEIKLVNPPLGFANNIVPAGRCPMLDVSIASVDHAKLVPCLLGDRQLGTLPSGSSSWVPSVVVVLVWWWFALLLRCSSGIFVRDARGSCDSPACLNVCSIQHALPERRSASSLTVFACCLYVCCMPTATGPLVVTQPQHGAGLVDSSDEELDESSASPSQGSTAAPPGGGTGSSSAWRWVAHGAGSGRLMLLGCGCCGIHFRSYDHSIWREILYLTTSSPHGHVGHNTSGIAHRGRAGGTRPGELLKGIPSAGYTWIIEGRSVPETPDSQAIVLQVLGAGQPLPASECCPLGSGHCHGPLWQGELTSVPCTPVASLPSFMGLACHSQSTCLLGALRFLLGYGQQVSDQQLATKH